MPEGSFTIVPDPDPAPPPRTPGGFTIVPDPDPALTPAAAAPTFTIVPDPDPAPVPSLAATVAPVDRDLEGQRAVAMATMPGPVPLPEVLAPQDFTDPMSGIPMAALPSLAQTVTPMGDRDLEGQRAAAMADPVSLGERFALNASDAYYGGTLAGSGLLAELQRAAQMSPQEWTEYNTAVRYAGGALKPLPSPAEAQAEIARITAARTRYEHIPGSGGPLELGTAIAGQLAGGLVTPESGINRVPGVAQGVGAISRAAPVIGRTVERAIGETGQAVAGRMLESGLSQGVVNTAVDPLAQVGSIQTGMQPGYDPLRTAIAFPAGVAIGAGMHGATEAAGAGVRALLPTPPVPATSPIDAAAVERLQPTGQVYRTERPSDLYPVPEPRPLPEITRTEIAPEQPVTTVSPPPPAGEPYVQTGVPVAPEHTQPAPAAEPPIARAEPTPSAAPIAEPPPERLPGAAAEPLRQEPPIAAPVEGSVPPAARSEVGPEASLLPSWVVENNRQAVELANQLGVTEQVRELATAGRTAAEISQALGGRLTVDQVRAVRDNLGIEPAGPLGTAFGPNIPRGEGVDRPGTAAGRPAEPAPVGETGAPGVVSGPGEAPGRLGVGTDLGERPGDTQAARAGEPVEPAAVPTEPPPRPAEAPATEPAPPVAGLTAEQTAIMRRNIADAEGSREGGVRVVADQLQYMPEAGREPGTPSEREAAHVIDRAVAAEIARGGDPDAFRNEAAQRGAGPVRPEDQAVVPPASREEPGALPAADRIAGPEVETTSTRPTNPSLERLRITEAKLAAKPRKTLLEWTKLNRIRQQISTGERFQEGKDRRAQEQQDRLDARRAGRGMAALTGTEPAGPPRNFKPKDFYDYKFNEGNSEYLQAVLEQAGHDPDTVTNMKMEQQHEILRQHMVNTFGFRDVTVAKDSTPVDKKTARDAMAEMSRAAQDLMASLGYPHEAASFFGTRSLVIDAGSKAGGRFGSYTSTQPGSGVIHVTGGANSFGHEWFHALDHVLAEQLTGNPKLRNELLTKYAREGQLDPKDGVQGAFARVLNKVFYNDAAAALREIDLINRSNRVDANGDPTKGAIEASRQLKELQQGRLNLRIKASEMREGAKTLPNARYFIDPVELLARAHEAYSADKMENAGVNPRGAVMDNEAYINESIELLKRLYPKGDERTAIFKAFDELHEEVAKAGILSEGGTKPPGAFPNLGTSDPVHYGLTLGPRRSNEEAAQARKAINKFANRTRQLETGQLLFNRTRPPPSVGQNHVQQLADGAKAVLYANYSIMDLIHDRAPDAAKAPLREIRDRLSTAPGEGRLINETLGEAQLRKANEWSRRFGNILENNGIDPRRLEQLDPEDDAMIRHHMTTAEKTYPLDPNNPTKTKPIPGDLIKVAGGLRKLMDDMYQHGRDTGLDLGYSDQFYPRLYDRFRIFNDEEGFVAQAKKAYGVGFDQDVGAPGSDPGATLEKWTTLTKMERDMAATAAPDLAERMTELNQNLRRQREIEASEIATPADLTELARLKTEATQLAAEAHPILRDHISEMAANDWYARLGEPVLHHFDTTGPGGRFLKARVLPPETDLLLRDYMYTSIGEAIPHYIEQMARRSSDAERFGPQGEDLARLLKLAQQGGVHPDELQWFADVVANVRGSDKPRDKKIQQLTTTAHALSSIMLMTRAVFSGLGEPMTAAITTRRAQVGMKTFINQFGGLIRTASARERTEIAELIGVTRAAALDSVLRSRMGADYSDSPGWNKFMTRFYRTSMLTGVVNSQRAHGAATMHRAAELSAAELLNEGDGVLARHARDDAERFFSENGIAPEYQKAFSQWIIDIGGRPSSALLQNDPMGAAYSLMIRRMVGRANQDPSMVDRAAGASGRGKLLFQLQSFAYSFGKNVLYPMVKDIEHSYGRARIEAQEAGSGPLASRARAMVFSGGTAAHLAAMTGTVLAAAIPGALLKLYLFDRERFDKIMANLDVFELIDQAWSRAGFNGPLDPLIQAFTHSKYDIDVSSIYDGPGPNQILKSIKDVIAPLVLGGGEDKPGTNTRLFNAWRGAYNLIGVPLSAGFLTWVGNLGGPALRFGAGLTMQKLTSPGVATSFAETMAGPKGVKPADASAGKLPALPKVPGLPQLPKLGQPPKPAPGAAGGSGPTPWGLVDDIMIPAWNKIGPVLNHIPFWGKVAGIAGGAGYAGYKAYEAGAPFRGQPAPPPKNARQ